MWALGRKRFGVQAASALLHNADLKGFFTGKISSGPLKSVCVPGLNCYSCPGAVGACPIGSLQSSLGALRFRLPAYVLGLLIFFGALLGRTVCGFLCPFGWLQELLHSIPFFRKTNRFALDRPLRKCKYAVLAVLVVILPACVKLTPFFCRYVCPAGTLSGMLLALHDRLVGGQLGWLFAWKSIILALTVFAALVVWRPFCKYLCPLGAFYGFFNRVSLHRLELRENRCTGCGSCAAVCRMCVDPSKTPGSAECIRCGACVEACPTGALSLGFGERAPGRKTDSD